MNRSRWSPRACTARTYRTPRSDSIAASIAWSTAGFQCAAGTYTSAVGTYRFSIMNSGLVTRTLILATLCVGLTPVGAIADGRVPASGTYYGTAQQRGNGASGNNVSKDYPVKMRFSSSGSRVTYRTLSCGGVLKPTGFSGGRRVYREQITSGGCDRGGVWKVLVSSNRRLQATWTRAGSDYIVSAILTR